MASAEPHLNAGALRRLLARLRRDPRIEAEALLRRLQWRIVRHLAPVVGVDTNGMRLFVSTADQTMSKGLFCYRHARQGDAELALAVLGSLGATDRLGDATVLEIGANIGSHTVEFLTRYGAGHVVAIEPDPGNFALLEHNVLENRLTGRTTLLALAVSDHDGMAELELSPDNAGDHRVRADGRADASRTAITVRTAAVDSLIKAGEVDLETVGFVWLDVQGHEPYVLRGASRLLGSGVPIVMEYWPDGLRRSGGLESLHRLLADHYPYLIDLDTRGEGQPQVITSAELPTLERARGWGDGRMVNPSTDLLLAPGIDPGWRLDAGATSAARRSAAAEPV